MFGHESSESGSDMDDEDLPSTLKGNLSAILAASNQRKEFKYWHSILMNFSAFKKDGEQQAAASEWDEMAEIARKVLCETKNIERESLFGLWLTFVDGLASSLCTRGQSSSWGLPS